MESLKFEIQIDGIWETLSPTFNDFPIKKVRDSEQIFVMRTTSGGTLRFKCPDTAKLVPYIGQTLTGRMTETICNNSHIYNIDLILSNTYDFYKKVITGKVVIKDMYYGLLDKSPEGLSFSANRNYQYSVGISDITFYNEDLAIATTQINKFCELIQFMLNQTDGTILFDSIGLTSWNFENEMNFNNLLISNNNNIYLYNQDDRTRKPFVLSLKEITDILLQKLFVGFYIESTSLYGFTKIIKFERLTKELFSNGFDLTDYNGKDNEVKNTQNITYLNDNDFSEYSYVTSDFDVDNDDASSEDFATIPILFDNENSIKTIKIGVESDILKKTESEKDDIFLFDATPSGNVINFSNFNKQFYNPSAYPFFYAEGDFDLLTLTSTSTVYSRINFDEVLFENVKLTIIFDCSVIGTDELYLRHSSKSQAVVSNYNYYEIPIFNGGNLYFDTTSILTNIEISNLELRLYPLDSSEYFKLYETDGVNNKKLSTPHLVENFGAEMPTTTATVDGVDYEVAQSNKFQQEINFNYQNTIESLDPFAKMKTSLGWMRVDEMSRKYNNNSFSQLAVTLTESVIEAPYVPPALKSYYYTTFDGVNEYVNLGKPDSLSFERTDAFSFSVWANLSDFVGNKRILGKAGPTSGVVFYIVTKRLYFLLYGVDGGSVGVISTDYIPENEWSNLIVTYNGNSAVSGVSLKIDGVDQVLVTVTDDLGSSILNSKDFMIGHNLYLFEGFLDEIRIFDKELTQAECETITNAGRGDPDLSSISNAVSYWKMDTLDPVDEIGENDGTSENMTEDNIIEWEQ